MIDKEFYKKCIVDEVNKKTEITYEQKFNTLLELMLDTKIRTNSMMNNIFCNINQINLDDQDHKNHETLNLINGVKQTLFDHAFLGIDFSKNISDDLSY